MRSLREPWRRRGLVAGTCLGLFAVLTAWVCLAGLPYFDWDLSATRAVQSARSPALDGLMRAVSWAGDDVRTSSLLVGGAFLLLAALRAWREALLLLGVVLVGQGLKIAVKNLVGRPRPVPELVDVLIEAKEVHSYPSGHTVHYVVFFGCLWFLTLVLVRPPGLRWPLLAMTGTVVALVGVARVYLGAHWVSDVLGGYLLGGAILAGGLCLYSRHGIGAEGGAGAR